ncbi:hypothetical protein [Nocardioides cavernaquae]|uniref:DUF1906 domain-containing protein n=1 Tax=Nocardioides cavernaquae TaxID=2321396 RepID=A0A3A5HBV2_9ACTN|nr:hypothetical protein [Nocardioides cavernaquae]RJS45534.1 hypothetical protein D4739_04395 [Nocardioides cavernaquae]
MIRSLFAASAVLLAVAGCGGTPREPAAPEVPAGASDSFTPGAALPGNRPTETAIDVPSNLDDLVASANANAGSIPNGPDRQVLGADASWPQCPRGMGIPQKQSKGAPMPTDAAEFVVLGLTNGPSFTPNPCLADQLAWVRERDLMVGAYAVVSWPTDAQLAKVGKKGPYDGATRLGALRNAGYQAALFTIATMREAGLRTPAVWIDVEPVPDFDWSADLAANAAVVEGTARGYRDAGLRIGYYSVKSLWQRVVGDLRVNAPEWRAAGQTSLTAALDRCSEDWSFGGGRAVLAQWVEDDRDRNVTCPGHGGRLGEWFVRP